MSFTGKVAIVTAAAGAGIGQATARAIAAKGASLVVSDQHSARTSEVAATIGSSFRVKCLGVVCDVTRRDDIANLVAKTVDAFGRIDFLVNNAGFDVFQELEEIDAASIEKIVEVNLVSTMVLTKTVLPYMIRQKSGAIVNLSSIAAHSPDSRDSAAYAASKAGIEAFTRSAAREVGRFGIRVNCIAPSVTLNPFLQRQMPLDAIKEISDKMPLGPISPEDQAKAIVFLLSDDASRISGATLNVTSGY